MKSYTDLEQSKKLAEILPLESADMSWVSNGLGKPFARTIPIKGDPEELCACWSLAALLGVLTENKICHYEDRYYCQHISEGGEFPYYSTAEYDNPVDGCVEMILNLHEFKMLGL